MLKPNPSMLSRRTLLASASVAAAAAATVHATRPASAAAPTAEATPASDLDPASADNTANIQVSHNAFTGHFEPSLAVNPRDQRNLLAVSRAAQGSNLGTATYVSFDDGTR